MLHFAFPIQNDGWYIRHFHLKSGEVPGAEISSRLHAKADFHVRLRDQALDFLTIPETRGGGGYSPISAI